MAEYFKVIQPLPTAQLDERRNKGGKKLLLRGRYEMRIKCGIVVSFFAILNFVGWNSCGFREEFYSMRKYNCMSIKYYFNMGGAREKEL